MSATETDPTAQLLAKLKTVADAIPFVEKRGVNTGVGGGYKFAQALDVVRDVRTHLLAQGVVVIPGAERAEVETFQTKSGATSFLTTVYLTYTFRDVATGAAVSVPWIGAGVDTGGEKGLYKAYTGGLKYALLSLFLLPMTEDPEHDGLTQPEAAPAAQPETTVDKDADRPAAPRIPIDRAKAIADAAVAAGLASWEEEDGKPKLSMVPVLKAQLATMGVSQVGQLDVDQAEAMEAFIAAEAEAQPA